jgi:hypothetical protein
MQNNPTLFFIPGYAESRVPISSKGLHTCQLCIMHHTGAQTTVSVCSEDDATIS